MQKKKSDKSKKLQIHIVIVRHKVHLRVCVSTTLNIFWETALALLLEMNTLTILFHVIFYVFLWHNRLKYGGKNTNMFLQEMYF